MLCKSCYGCTQQEQPNFKGKIECIDYQEAKAEDKKVDYKQVEIKEGM